MSPSLRPLQLPLLVEERRRKEEEEAAQREAEVDVPYNFYTTDSYSSDTTSPVTPTFSARGHLRCSSSMSSFDLTTVVSSDSTSSPTQTAQNSGKRVLPDVEEEPIEYDDDSDSDYDDASDSELYQCLCDEPCIHRDTDLMQSTSNFYTRKSADYDLGFFSDGDFSFSLRSRKRKDGSESSFAGFSHRIGSRFPSLSKWKSSKPSSIISSPVSEYGFDQRPILSSRAPSSRSSSVSAAPSRKRQDRSNDPAVPPTPALSRFGSSDSFMQLGGGFDIKKANDILSSIERDRRSAITPLLPPIMASSTEQILAQQSGLESPTIASQFCPIDDEIYSSGMLSPPLSTRPSSSSLRHMPGSVELPQLPAPDAWSDRLGHANYTIVPKPYKPETSDLDSLRQFRGDWEIARVNYTKHLARTGEHYGQTSKTYALTEAKWAETQRTWRNLHDEIAEAVVASGEATTCEKFDEGVLTTVPKMYAEGKFPERGDEDIVGPMVREATMMSMDSVDRKGSGFWRHLAGKVGLRK